MYLVTFAGNQKGMIPPACKMIRMANNWIKTLIPQATLSFGGITLCFPPMENSPNGNPIVIRIVNTVAIPNITAPIIATICILQPPLDL